MNKFPVELLSTKTQNAKAGCPIVFDGFNIIVDTSDAKNLNNIVRDLNTALTRSNSASNLATENKNDIDSITSNLSIISNALVSVQSTLNSVASTVNGDSGVSTRLAAAEQLLVTLRNDLQNLAASGGGGGGGGASIKQEWINILTALQNGTYFRKTSTVSATLASNSTAVELNASAPDVEIESAVPQFITVSKTNNSHRINVVPSGFQNYIKAGNGLKTAFASNALTISPDSSLIKAESGSNIKVSFNSSTGQFTIGDTGLTGGGTPAPAPAPAPANVVLDGITLIRDNVGAIAVNRDVFRAAHAKYTIVGKNFYDPSILTKSSDFLSNNIPEYRTMMITALGATSIPNLQSKLAKVSQDYRDVLASTTNQPFSNATVKLFTTALPHTGFRFIIPEQNDKCSMVMDVKAEVRISTTNASYKFGILPISLKSVLIPQIFVYMKKSNSTEAVAVVADFIQHAKVNGTNDEGVFTIDLSDSVHQLDAGTYTIAIHCGFFVGAAAASIWTNMIGKVAMDFRVETKVSFN